MGLETRRVSETRKVTEKPKTAEELRREQLKEKDSLRRMVTELKELAEKSNSDIDQTWVRENESKEFSFSTPSQRNDNNQMVQNAFAQMDGIGAFGKNARSSGMSTKELHELNESKAQSIVPQPEETILQTENTSSQPVEISSEIKNDDQPEAVSQEQNPLNNTTMLQELENSINERINYILQDSKADMLLTNHLLIHKANDTVKSLIVESESSYFSEYEKDVFYHFPINLQVADSIKSVMIRPCTRFCIVKDISIKLNGKDLPFSTNAYRLNNGIFYFDTDNPVISFIPNIQGELNVFMNVFYVDKETSNSIKTDYEKLLLSDSTLKNIQNSKFWKITKPLRWILRYDFK